MPEAQETSGNNSSWKMLTATSLLVFFFMGAFNSFGIFLVVFVKHFGESKSKTAWLCSIAYFLCYFLYPVVLRLRTQFGLCRVMMFTSILISLTFILTPLMPYLDYLFVTYSLFFGIAYSFVDAMATITLKEFFEKNLSLALGIRYASSITGTMIFSIFLPILFDRIGWRVTFWILSIISIPCLGFCLTYYIVDGPRDWIKNNNLNADKRERRKISYFQLLRDKNLGIFLAAHSLFLATFYIPVILMVEYATCLGFSLSEAKWLMVVRSFMSLIGSLSAGKLGRVALVNRKVKYVQQIEIFMFGLGSLLCSFTKSLSLLLIYMGLSGVVDGIYFTILPLQVVEIIGEEHSNDALALFYFFSSFAVLSGPPINGYIYDLTDNFSYVFYTIFTLCSIATILIVLSSGLPHKETYGIVDNTKIEVKDCANRPKVTSLAGTAAKRTVYSSLLYETSV